MGGVRHTAVALAAIWALAAPGLLLANPAAASAPAVRFDGGGLLGLPLLACGSHPDVTTIDIHAGETVAIDNATGHNATIDIAGPAPTGSSHVNAGATIPIAFPAGTWTLTLIPDCLANLAAAGFLTVRATESPSPSDSPTPTPDSTPTVSPTRPRHSVAPTSTATGTPPAGRPNPPPATASAGTSPSVRPSLIADGTMALLANTPQIGDPVADPAASTGSHGVNALLVLVAGVIVVGVASACLRAVINGRHPNR